MLFVEGIKNSDITICESITDIRERDTCKNKVFTEKSVKEKNKKGCEQISLPSTQQNCLLQVAIEQAKTEKTLSFCDTFQGEQQQKCITDAVFFIITQTKDSQWCKFLSTEVLQKSCLRQIPIS